MGKASCVFIASCIVLVAAAVLGAPPLAEAAAAAAPSTISCGFVTSTLAPCYQYILNGGNVPNVCCEGVNSLYKAANSTAKRRSVCACLKSVTGGVANNKAIISNAKSLPGKCGVSLPFEITPTINCRKVT